MTTSGETKILRTKESIRNALIRMLKCTDIDRVTIKELCQISQINRTTFYKYYGSQYDVLNEIASIYISKTADLLMNDLNSGQKMTENLTNALQFIKDNADFFILFLGKENSNLSSGIIAMLPDFNSFVISSMKHTLSDEEKKYLAAFIMHGSLKMISDWVVDGCIISCKNMCNLILNASGRVIEA